MMFKKLFFFFFFFIICLSMMQISLAHTFETPVLYWVGYWQYDSNSSDYWDGLDTINSTQMEDSGGTLNIIVSWLESLFILDSDEGNLNVNSADYWDELDSPDDFENIKHTGNITNPINSTWGIFNDGDCIVIGDLSYVSEC